MYFRCLFHLVYGKNNDIDYIVFFIRESFMKGQDMENYNIELDRIGFEKWKNMSKEVK